MVHKTDFELTKSVLQGFIVGPALTVKNFSKVRTLRQLPCAIKSSTQFANHQMDLVTDHQQL